MGTRKSQNFPSHHSRNPFNTGSPARGEGFFNRQDILGDVISFLRKSAQFNFLIWGQRRIGKTSLLRRLQDGPDLDDLAYPVYFNLQDKARTRLPQLLFEIARRINVDLDLELEVKENDFLDNDGPLYFKETFIPAVCENLGSPKQLLLLFDEFDVLGEIEDVEGDPTIESFAYRSFIPFIVDLIEEIHYKKYPVKFVFAVGRHYRDLDSKRFGQLTKFGNQREISNFSEEETKEFLGKSSIILFDKEAIDEIYSLTSGYPFFVQCLAGLSFDHAEKKGAKSISKEIVRKEFIPAIKSHRSGVNWIWDTLSVRGQIILYLMAIIKEENKPLNIRTIREKAVSLNVTPATEKLPQTLHRLKECKFIRELHTDGNGYDFYAEFMRKWIAEEISKEEIEKKLDDID
jgi:hypothetical protein